MGSSKSRTGQRRSGTGEAAAKGKPWASEGLVTSMGWLVGVATQKRWQQLDGLQQLIL
jgi:hypothetical protein